VPGILEVAAHSLAAVLGVWLGLTVATRAGTPASRVFALLSLAIATWSSSIIVERLSTSVEAALMAHAVEELMAAVTIAGTAHFSLAIASEGLPSARRRRIVFGIYVANFVFAAPTILSTLASLPRFTDDPLPGAVFGWVWIAVRLTSLAIGARWLLQALGVAAPGSLRQRQVRAALATVATGGVGGGMRFLPVIGQLDAWIGVSLVAMAVVLAAYAVFSAGIFFGPAVAGRAFRTSLLGALGSFVVISLVLGVEAASRALTRVELPLFTAIALVVTVTLYEPITQLLRRRLGGDGPRAVARRRLLLALGQSGPTAQSAEAGVQPALARLAAALEVKGLAVARADGGIVASEGTGAASAWIEAIPLVADGDVLGELRVGATISGDSLSPRDQDLVRMSAAYVAAALRAGRREDEQVEQLAGLAEERAAVETQASTLHAALVQHAEAPVGLRIHALGPLRVERAGESIERWGGDKAGTRQAQGLFAFLLDRGERGVTKDEAVELIWPDTDLERADLAFHRTMVGLRQTLDPRRDGRTSQVIRFHNDRYRLDPSIVAWSDVATFLGRLDAAKSATDPAERLAILEEARALYGGDFVDDCPFYGDSAEVEEQRVHLRGRATDLRIAIAEAYEALGDRLSAAAAFREAIRGEPAGSPPAQAGLARLGL
jgi:DNA-binding SARP family transcriptional activator